LSITDITDYKFAVKQGQPSRNSADDAPVCIACEPLTAQLKIVWQGMLFIQIKDDTKYAQAQGIPSYLRMHVKGIGYLP
jgi:hypothetical protein